MPYWEMVIKMIDITNKEKIEVIGQHIHIQELKLEELNLMLEENPSEEIKAKIMNAIGICNARIRALQATLDQLL